MSDYQKALEAAHKLKRWVARAPDGRAGWLCPEGIVLEVPLADADMMAAALTVADMLLRNHAISHGEKPEA